MTWITDNPIPLFILGLLAQIVLGAILWQTGRGGVMYAMIVLGIVSVALIVAEIVIVSPTEEIADTLAEIAAALETNKPENVLAYIAPDKRSLRDDATQQLKRVQIREAVITGDLRVAFGASADSQPPTATASFNARIKAKFLKDTSPYEQVIQRFTVNFRKEDDRWLVIGYQRNSR
jgi:hypothetical protein